MPTKRIPLTVTVDIGGTKTAFCLFDEAGEELFYDCFPTRPDRGADDLVNRLREKITERLTEARAGLTYGIAASPGPLDLKTGSIIHVATMGWRNVPVVRLLSKALGCPFILLNDCDAGALGVWNGADPTCYISISTGVGGGTVIGGKLFTGNGNASEFGHLPVPGEGLRCNCGNADCLELYASGSGIERRYAESAGKPLGCAQIAKRAREGDPLAIRLFTEAGEKIAFALTSIKKTIDPEEIVFGGSVCRDYDLFLPAIRKKLPFFSPRFAPQPGKQVLYGAYRYGLSLQP